MMMNQISFDLKGSAFDGMTNFGSMLMLFLRQSLSLIEYIVVYLYQVRCDLGLLLKR